MQRASLVLPLAVALLVASCRTARGPAIGAADIVEGYSAPDVHADTVDARFSVSIDRARWALRSRAAGTDFWSNVAVLDVANAERTARSMEERTFVSALRTLMEGDPESAAVAFALLHRQASDVVVRSRSRVGLTMALSWRSDWAGLAGIGEDADGAGIGADSLTRAAGVERWGRALAGIPAPEITVPESAVVLPMRRSALGTPVMTVHVNGRPHEFWLDTGASMTLLSAAVAVECGVKLAAPDTLALGVVVGHIPARAIYIDSLELGPMRVRGLAAALVDPGMLRIDRMLVGGEAHGVPIAGVIGTDLLRHMDVVLDAAAGTITIRRPRPNPRAVRNLYWVGYPVVRLVTREGQPVLFGLDTGAEGSYVTTSLLRKAPRTPVAARRGSMSGLGPGRELTSWVARDVGLSDGDYAIRLKDSPVTSERRWTFVQFDGVIGSDVALTGRLHLDFLNGVFDVRPSAGAHVVAPAASVTHD